MQCYFQSRRGMRHHRSRRILKSGASFFSKPFQTWSTLLVLLGLMSGCVGDTDTIHFANGGTGQNGILVDGMQGTIEVNDYRPSPRASGKDMTIGNFTSAPPGEIIAFTKHRLPTVVAFDENDTVPFWTKGSDEKTIRFNDEYCMDAHVWIITGSSSSQRQRALDALAVTSQIWAKERQGLCFKNFRIEDRTKDIDLGPYNDPMSPSYEPGRQFQCSEMPKLVENGRVIPHIINVYYVTKVNSGDRYEAGEEAGDYCAQPIDSIGQTELILMGSRTSPALLAHEIGHALILGHVDSITQYFDDTNVMHSASDDRRYMTEGQTFRVAMNSESILNRTDGYNARAGLQTRMCPGNNTNASNRQCPPIQERIWKDGVWPPS